MRLRGIQTMKQCILGPMGLRGDQKSMGQNVCEANCLVTLSLIASFDRELCFSQVHIHEEWEYPLVGRYAISVAPQTETAIGFKRHQVTNVSKCDYSKDLCITNSWVEFWVIFSLGMVQSAGHF